MGKSTKKLIIVCDEKTEAYANYLRQLISTNDDKDGEVVGIADGTVDAAVWLEKDYLANKAQISSNEHILFIGDSKTSKSESSSMIIRFEKYGMKYGWLGKRGMMLVDNEMLDPDQYDQFIEYCLGYETEFERIAMKKPNFKGFLQKKDEKAEEDGLSEVPDDVVEDNVEIVEKPDSDIKKKIPKALAVAGAAVAGAVVGAGAVVPAVGASAAMGISKGINKMQVHKKVKDQQYRALSVILYIDGLKEFLEG
ncbi:MAG: hypothetical protein E7298_13715 [Lachnospiraceae bacterium]|nr:hypothetical protein [Lachnospiraceae bacterium]